MQENEEVLEEELSDPQMAVLASVTSLTLDMAGQGSGKSRNIGYDTGMMIQEFPRAKGFLAANTQTQLSQSTLAAVFTVWESIYAFTEYEKRANPMGQYVVNRRPPPHFKRYYKLPDYRQTISFWNGTLIFIGSLENYAAHEGKEFAWAHLDETKDTEEDAIKKVILGRLRQYGLWCDQEGNLYWDEDKANERKHLDDGWKATNPLKIHSSPADDTVQWLNTMFQLPKFQKEILKKCQARGADFFYREFEGKTVVIYSAYHNEKNLPPGHLQQKEKNYNDDQLTLKNIDGYPFAKSGGVCYPAFSRNKHVIKVTYVPGVPVLQSWDFNALPHMTCLCAQVFVVIRFINEVGVKYDQPGYGLKAITVTQVKFYRNYCPYDPVATVDQIGMEFEAEHDPATCEVDLYGDGRGLARVEGLGNTTRFDWVKQAMDKFIHNSSMQARWPNVGPMARMKLVNDILAGLYPEIEVYFDESMEETISDMEIVKKGPEGKVKQRKYDENIKASYETVGHESDCVEYLLSEIFKEYLKT